jgi:hypothetical protein
VAARLTEEEYDRWLVTSDVILLPYEAARYRYSTSGIFAECVAAGGIPLVTPGTWMATELEKHSLSELVIGWNDPRRVLETITTLARDLRVRQKLDRMRERFADFHSEAGYAATMRELVPAEMGR